ncbi:LacI family DNA-binding transcriptional regulator [Amnibacterium sp.]|uniref:LacI family DNA-binding transcriptional regulator n=1 Tax=Amnibacterium sp. TaxID=1872496 RepID=UPI003F7BA849
MVGVKDVARHAGVSVGTVSNVLNGRESVAPEFVERVQKAVAELGFVRDDVARTLRAGTSNVIGLIVSEAHNPFFIEVARGAEAEAVETGGIVLLGNSHGDAAREDRYLEAFYRQRARGVVVHMMDPEALSRPTGQLLHRRGMPIVTMDVSLGQQTFSSISVDNRAGAGLAASHLMEQGRRRLLFAGGPMALEALQQRLAGIQDCLHGGAVLEVFETFDTSIEDGIAAAQDVLRRRGGADAVDAVIAGNDLVAIGILNVLVSAGVAVPEEVAVVGYDDIDLARTAVVPVTTVRQPAGVMGAMAVRLLENERLTAAPPEHVLLDPELVVRRSTVRVR